MQMNTRVYFMAHSYSPPPEIEDEGNQNTAARAPPVAFFARTAMRISRARWFRFLRRVFRYQNGPRSDVMSSPFNSMPWFLIEFAVLVVQIVVVTVMMVVTRNEKPVWPLKVWVAGYNVGNLFSMLHLFWRYRSGKVGHGGAGVGPPDIELQRRNSEQTRSCHLMNKSRTCLELFFAIWFVMGNVWIFDTRYRSFAGAPRLHALCVSLLAWNAVGYSFPFLLFLLLCCCVPLVSRAVGINMSPASNDSRGASEDQISALPTCRYKDVVAANERARENTEICCICLARYGEKEEVRQLPCLHLFHQRCVDQWLRMISCCPLCKQELDT